MPSSLPTLKRREIEALEGLPYSEVAFRILSKFLGGELMESGLTEICSSTYDFPVPLEVLDGETSVLYLDRGPTASFKDFAARFIARTMTTLKTDSEVTTILVATSGDTGGAVGEAFRGVDGFRVFILYPSREVGEIQRQQLERLGENVRTLCIEGQFDDCQKLVRKAFLDPKLSRLNLTSSNSINVGRILPQIVYYFYAWANAAPEGESIIFSVPSGNFGNSLGCEIARRMGLPVKKLILAVNENDEFPEFLSSGEYAPLSPSRQCLSNAMNVGNPSNLARYFDLYSGHLLPDGTVEKAPDLPAMRENIWSVSISDEKTQQTIAQTLEEHDIVLDPHGAVGLAALNAFRESAGDSPALFLETAHPGKFPEIVSNIIGTEITLPPSLEAIMERPRRVEKLRGRYEDFQAFLLDQP